MLGEGAMSHQPTAAWALTSEPPDQALRMEDRLTLKDRGEVCLGNPGFD